MVSVKKYPTAYTNPDAWTNPANATGAEDGLCASKNTVNFGDKLLPVSTYGFSLPLTAILDNIYIAHKGIADSSVSSPGLVFEWVSMVPTTINFQDNGTAVIPGGNCGVTDYNASERDILPFLISNSRVPSISDINNEIGWMTEVRASPDRAVAMRFYVDACYIKIVYHTPPTVSGGQKGEMVAMLGITLAISQKKRRRRVLGTILDT